jgi:arylsulfatase A-like enzyme
MRILLLPVLFFAIALPAAFSADENRPNILMIAIDDLNDWVGAMNAHPNARTPNIDALAETGTLFTNAHAAAPLCGPTRAAILSGLRPSTTGIYGHNDLDAILENPHIAETTLLPFYFREHGYKLLATGKIFHEGSPLAAFDEVGLEQRDFGPRPARRVRLSYVPPEGTHTSTDWGVFPETDEEMPDYRSAQWAIEQLGKQHDRPFFLSVGFVRPHVPWYVPQKWFDLHPLEEIVLPLHREDQFDDLPETAKRFSVLPAFPKMEWMREEQRWEKSVQAYLASVSFVDYYIGEILDALAQSPYADNTIVMLWSDHGYHLGQKGIWAKHTLWEESTRIPMIIARPGDNQPRQSHRPVDHLDIYPTLLELANLPPNPSNEGRSLVPLLDDPEAEGFEAALTTHGYGNHAVRTLRWRYIRYEDGAEELYDHFVDPNEWKNLAGRAQYEKIIAELRNHLPDTDAAWDPLSVRGADYNDYFSELLERTRADR